MTVPAIWVTSRGWSMSSRATSVPRSDGRRPVAAALPLRAEREDTSESSFSVRQSPVAIRCSSGRPRAVSVTRWDRVSPSRCTATTTSGTPTWTGPSAGQLTSPYPVGRSTPWPAGSGSSLRCGPGAGERGDREVDGLDRHRPGRPVGDVHLDPAQCLVPAQLDDRGGQARGGGAGRSGVRRPIRRRTRPPARRPRRAAARPRRVGGDGAPGQGRRISRTGRAVARTGGRPTAGRYAGRPPGAAGPTPAPPGRASSRRAPAGRAGTRFPGRRRRVRLGR